jgi:hypothetical protein
MYAASMKAGMNTTSTMLQVRINSEVEWRADHSKKATQRKKKKMTMEKQTLIAHETSLHSS